jgi:hypothetical protein
MYRRIPRLQQQHLLPKLHRVFYLLHRRLVQSRQHRMDRQRNGRQVEIVEQNGQMVVQPLRRRHVELEGARRHHHHRDRRSVAEPQLQHQRELGPLQRLLQVISVDQHVAPEQNHIFQGHFFVPVQDLEGTTGAVVAEDDGGPQSGAHFRRRHFHLDAQLGGDAQRAADLVHPNVKDIFVAL